MSPWSRRVSTTGQATRREPAVLGDRERPTGVARSSAWFIKVLPGGVPVFVAGILGVFFPSLAAPLATAAAGASLFTVPLVERWFKRKEIEAQEERQYALDNSAMTVSGEGVLLEAYSITLDALKRISEIKERVSHNKEALEECKSTLLGCLGGGSAIPDGVREMSGKNEDAQKCLDEAYEVLNQAFQPLQNVIRRIGVA